MAKVKVDAAALQQFLEAGCSQAEAAKHFGVTEAAVSQRVKQLRIATSKVVALERAGRVVDQKLDATERLQVIQRVILDQLRWAEQQAREPEADRAALADVLVKLSAEVRAQVRLEHDISRTLIDLRVVREFQRTVFEVISKESPEAARRIVTRLKEQQALRRSAELPALDGRSGFDLR